MSQKEKVIVVYLDDYDKIDTEFSWLYKTWKFNQLDYEYDLMVFYEPAAQNRLSKYPGIISIAMPCIGMADVYPFLKSSYMFNEPWCEHIRPYKYVLKTDCDVFLTHHLKGYTPHQLLIGKGGFYETTDQKKIFHLKSIADRLGKRYQFMTNIGSSMFGNTLFITSIFQAVNTISEKILKEKWFGPFSSGVTSMMAGEIAVNDILSNQHVVLYALDYICWESTMLHSDTLHIHAWHTSARWSKHRFFEGKYSDWVVESYTEALKNAANYCHWFATLSLESLLSPTIRVDTRSFKVLVRK